MKTFAIYSPNNNQIISELDYSGFEETSKLIDKAQKGFDNWKNILPLRRAEILEKWYELVKKNRELIAKIMHEEQGKPIEEALIEVDYGNSFIKFYAQEATRVLGEVSTSFKSGQWSMNIYEPIGVVAAITPWNFPCAMVTKKIAPAIAAGCPIILKPSEETPLTAIKLHQLAIEAGVPEEVFSLVCGDYKEIGRAFLEHKEIKMISFTGSIEVGKYLMRESANSVKKLVLELGGNAPCIILKDANLDFTVQKIITGKFRNAGQACTSPNRIFVAAEIKDIFIEKLVIELKKNNYKIGPLINHAQKNRAVKLLEDAVACGAKVFFQSDIPSNQNSDLYFPPVIVTNLTDDIKLVKDEAFSPIFSILTFSSEEEVVKRANDTDYGLAAYIFSQDLKKTIEISHKLNFGVIAINDSGTANEKTIHGGFNQSGLGREGGKEGLMEYFENKFIVF